MIVIVCETDTAGGAELFAVDTEVCSDALKDAIEEALEVEKDGIEPWAYIDEEESVSKGEGDSGAETPFTPCRVDALVNLVIRDGWTGFDG
jgi:hypothetical protein